MKTSDARTVALEVLERVLLDGSYSNIELNYSLSKNNLKHEDINLATNIIYGVLQNKLTIDFYLQPYLKGKKVDDWVNILLLISVYQFEYLDKVPAHAIINESVEIAKKRGKRGIGNFVNAVLRNYQRKGHQDISIIKDEDNRLSVKYSMPLWIVKKLKYNLGNDKALSILNSLNKPANISLRVNTKKVSVEELKHRLSEKNISVQDSEISEFGLTTTDRVVLHLDEFKKGLYTIQDESSQLVAPTLDVQPDSNVLDACAAPGGKTTHIGSFLDANQGGKVLGLDIYKHKVELIQKNAERLGMSDVVFAKEMDANNVSDLKENFDRVLVDAPCSGLGLLRRKPEMRYSRSESDISVLQKIQLEILDNASAKVSKNGILVYSTCTITPEENEDVVNQFLSTHPTFEKIKIDNKLGKNNTINIYPDDYETDGFFISKFKRKEV